MNQTEIIAEALDRGERLAVLSALQMYGVYALSQRAGELVLATPHELVLAHTVWGRWGVQPAHWPDRPPRSQVPVWTV